jgi:hypothetical protein
MKCLGIGLFLGDHRNVFKIKRLTEVLRRNVNNELMFQSWERKHGSYF